MGRQQIVEAARSDPTPEHEAMDTRLQLSHGGDAMGVSC